MNRGTASGAEMIAGSLQQAQRAAVLGERTFGKGTVQVLVALPDGAALKVSTAQYLLPDGSVFEGRGIEVDVELANNERDDSQPDPGLLFAQQMLSRAGDANRGTMLKATEAKLGTDARAKSWRHGATR